MDQRGTWGDHVTLQVLSQCPLEEETCITDSRLQAAANVYGVEIHLLTSYADTVWMEIKPKGEAKAKKILWLSFLAELHYNSLYTQQGTPLTSPRPTICNNDPQTWRVERGQETGCASRRRRVLVRLETIAPPCDVQRFVTTTTKFCGLL